MRAVLLTGLGVLIGLATWCCGYFPASTLTTTAASFDVSQVSTRSLQDEPQYEDALAADFDLKPMANAALVAARHERGDAADATQATAGTNRTSHWAWQPLLETLPPAVSAADWSENPVDRFVYEWLQSEQVSPATEASWPVLRRRLSLGITGLPASTEGQFPERAKIDIDEVSSLVNRLLETPESAEHFAEYWLNLVRYADTNGYEDDGPKPLVWKYRDYVIRSFMNDKPYNAFVLEQVAGDLLPKATSEQFVASGYLRLGPWNSEPDDLLAARFDQLDEIASTTSEIFLGLTLACARCHDHPHENLSSEDYYSLLACFADLQRPVEGRMEIATPAADSQTQQTARKYRAQQRFFNRQALTASSEHDAQQWRKQARELENKTRLEQAYFLPTTSRTQPTAMYVLERGNPKFPRIVVQPALPTSLTSAFPIEESEAIDPGHARLRLARWLTENGNPLTARLIVNRVWAWHFGTALAETQSNFGTAIPPPKQLELLNWLSHWFVNDADWSLRKLHHLLLTSRTFRTDWQQMPLSNTMPAPFPRRMSASQLRDSLLAASGLLQATHFGPSTSAAATMAMPPSDRPQHDDRRTVYRFVKRAEPDLLLSTFDGSERSVSSGGDSVTHTAAQVLTLLNSEFASRQIRTFAQHIEATAGHTFADQLELATQTLFGRAPSATETRVLLELYLQELSESQTSTRALQNVLRTLIGLNEFLFIP